MSNAPWLHRPIEHLRGLGERLPHALLVEGPPGWGTGRVADTLALHLVDSAAASARQVAHPDLRWIEPEAGVIRVDATRRATAFLLQTPQVARRKVAVIDNADAMNLNAANALLKTLEEPPPDSFLALATGAPARLLPTVRSRCQRVVIRPVARDALLAWLRAQGVPAALAGLLVVEYGGAPFRVLDAASTEQPPLWPLLSEAARVPRAASRFVDAQRDASLPDLAGRWLRIVCWLARQLGPSDAAAALRFADDLVTTRRIALLNAGLARAAQLRRLVSLWVEIWPLFSGAAPPTVAPPTAD